MQPDREGAEGDPSEARSDWFCGEHWAFIQNVPFRKYRHFSPKGIAARGEWRHQPGHLIDILPTCLDVAGGEFPRERQGKPSIPPEGRRLVPAFAGEPTPAVMSVLFANAMLPGAFVVYRTVNGVTTARAKRRSSCSVRRR